jgi:hypothetical protein
MQVLICKMYQKKVLLDQGVILGILANLANLVNLVNLVNLALLDQLVQLDLQEWWCIQRVAW